MICSIPALTSLLAADPTVDTADWLGRATGPVVLAGVVLALIKGWLVTGRECMEVRRERDKALDLVYKQAEITQRALDVSEKKL